MNKFCVIYWYQTDDYSKFNVELCDTMEQAAECHLENGTYGYRSQVFASSLDPSFWNAEKGFAIQRYMEFLIESGYHPDRVDQMIEECKQCLIN